MHPPRQRTAEEDKARAAAKQAEKELWERTRGAGSAVFKLAEAGKITQRRIQGNRISSGLPVPSTEENNSGLPKAARQEDLLPWGEEDILPTLEEVEKKRYELVDVPSGDILLSRGISDYTILPKVLGRGKFSTVFMASKNGERWAIKHTALFPHHQLIATRLLREPTLLAELPPHPNLVAVKETIRTPGHFYLVEEFLDGYVTLEALIPMYSETQPATLPAHIADRILTQLLSAVRAIHVPLQICHRDIKPENILVHPQTFQLKLLDFGLATHFSKSEPKLSTCCGSPAFHCPEIVKALSSPPGTVVYMGPEVDAWTCGVTMLRCLTGARFPLGASHSSLRGMAIRAQRAVASIQDCSLRLKVGALLDMDGRKRMQKFDDMVIEQERALGEPQRSQKRFKSTTFIPLAPTHSIRLPILEENITPGMATPASLSRRSTPANSRPPSPSFSPSGGTPSSLASFTALNPTHQPPERVLSFIKYCLRCAGILYHTWPDLSGISTHSPKQHWASLSHPLTGASAAFAEAVGLASDAASTPATPLFPPSVSGEERSDGYAHVQVFQCVMEAPDKSPDEGDGQGQMSLVQSIMAAFGRKVATPAQQTPQRSVSPAARPASKRSMSTPARKNTESSASSYTALSKDGSVQCLAFHLIVRFPRHSTSFTRPALSKAASFVGPSVNDAVSTRSRAGSSAAFSGLEEEELTSNELHDEVMQKLKKLQFSSTKEREGRLRNPKEELTNTSDSSLGEHAAVNGATSPYPNRSPSASRPQSRTRKRSHRNSYRRPTVLFQVTDERALQAVKNALSVGGSVEAKPTAQREGYSTPQARKTREASVPPPVREISPMKELSTDLTDEDATPKEISLAIQERLEVIAVRSSDDKGTLDNNSRASSPERGRRENGNLASQSRSAEVARLLQYLASTLPRIKTQKPTKFVEPTITLVPRAIRSAIQEDLARHYSSHTKSFENRSDRPPDAFQSRGSSSSVIPEQITARACDISLALCSLIEDVHQWNQLFEEGNQIAKDHILSLFLGSMIVILPDIPKPQRFQTLSSWYFSVWKPRYAYSRPSEKDALPGIRTSSLSTLTTQAFAKLEHIVQLLHLDLESTAFVRLSVPTNDTADLAIRSMGAFLLCVNLMARKRRDIALDSAVWSRSDAKQRLHASLPLLVASLGNDAPTTTSKDGSLTLGGSAHLPDAALCWLMWCVEGLEEDKIEDEEAILLLRILPSHAAVCPDPSSRHVSLELVRTLLERHVDTALAQECLVDMVTDSSYPHLRVAALGLARTLIATNLELEQSIRFATPAFIDQLEPLASTLPDTPPDLSDMDIDKVGAYLDRSESWFGEVFAFFYLVITLDHQNKSGIRNPARLRSILVKLLDPLDQWMTAFLGCQLSHSDSSPEQRLTKQTLDTNVSILLVGLRRAKQAMQSVVLSESSTLMSEAESLSTTPRRNEPIQIGSGLEQSDEVSNHEPPMMPQQVPSLRDESHPV